MVINELLKEFDLRGEVTSIEPYGNGLINKTFLVKTTQESYIFQYVNAKVFPDVDMLMNNIYLVTEHIRAKGMESLEIVKTKAGGLYLRSGEDFFRGYVFIKDSLCYESLPNLELVRKCAQGFGAFHAALCDIDMSRIGDVIPDFHNTKKRFGDFEKALAINASKRADQCKEETEFLLSRKKDYSLIVDAIDAGLIRNSVSHNDPKINNVVFDKNTGEVKCVIDLDTVMGGTFLYDFGDGLRSLFTGANEDSTDLSLLKADLAVYETYLDGYYSMMKGAISEKEIELLPWSILIITEELAMRFLGDFIAGDVYFHVAYPEHNLVRARTQIALAKDILAHMDEIRAITARVVDKYR